MGGGIYSDRLRIGLNDRQQKSGLFLVRKMNVKLNHSVRYVWGICSYGIVVFINVDNSTYEHIVIGEVNHQEGFDDGEERLLRYSAVAHIV